VVISFNSHDTTFASWHIFTCHNALRLFKNSHNTKFRVVAFSLMPQRFVVGFAAQWAFSIFELNISTIRYRRAAEELKLQPFRFQPVYQLQARDAAVRINYCRRFHSVWPSRSPDLTSPAFFPWEFLKEGVYTKGAWRTLNVAMNILLPALTSKLFEKLQETLRQGWMIVFKKAEDIFTVRCNYTLIVTFLVSLKKQK